MQELNILVSTDHNYVLPLRAMLRSLFVNNQDCDITVYLLHSGLPEEDLQLLNAVAAKYGGSLVSYIVSREQQDISAAVVKTLPSEAYYRMLLIDYLPETVKRVLYLDCDILVNGSLAELFNMPMSIAGEDGQTRRCLFAAAPDAVEFAIKDTAFYNLGRKMRKKAVLSDSQKYVNTGVLLIDVELMRKLLTIEEMLEYIDLFSQIKDDFYCNDQDFINYIFKNYICYFNSMKYNFSPLLQNSKTEIHINDPVIIHFCGSIYKPWHENYPQNRNILVQAKQLYNIYSADDF